MKHLYTIILVFIIITLSPSADGLFAAKGLQLDSFGVKAGLNFAQLEFSEENADQWKSDPGFQVGLFCTLKLNRMFVLQPEIYYVSKGVRINDTYLGREMSSTVKLDYVEVPLLLKVLILPGARTAFQPALFVGGYWAYNTSAKFTFQLGEERVEDDITDQMRKADYGLIAGGSIDYKTGMGNFLLDFRFSLGMKTLRKDGDDDEFKVKNKTIAFMVGYSF